MAENTELMELQRRLHDSHESSAALRSKIERLEREMETAWGLIANAGVTLGDWESLPRQWQECAARWRDRYFGKPNDQAQRPAE